MIEKINATLLKTLQPEESPFEISDSQLKGFILRVQPSGRMTYYVRYRLRNGKQNRVKLGTTATLTPAQARDEAKQKIAATIKGEDPGEARRGSKTEILRDFIDGPYKEWADANRRTSKEKIDRLKRNFACFLDYRLDAISTWDLEKWRLKRSSQSRPNGKKISESTINRDIAYLKSALSKAVEWGLIDTHPLKQVKLKREDHGRRIRYLTSDERERLLKALDKRDDRLRAERDSANAWRRERGYPEFPDLRSVAFVDYFKPMVILSLHTGLRRGELFSLAWEDVNFSQRLLTVQGEKAKSGRTRHLPLNATALSVLSDWKTQQSDLASYVFMNPKTGKCFDNVTKNWKAILAEAEITEFRWHDMRHDFASQLVMAGVDLNTVRELLGHADLKMTLRYAHLAPEHKAQAVSALDKLSY